MPKEVEARGSSVMNKLHYETVVMVRVIFREPVDIHHEHRVHTDIAQAVIGDLSKPYGDLAPRKADYLEITRLDFASMGVETHHEFGRVRADLPADPAGGDRGQQEGSDGGDKLPEGEEHGGGAGGPGRTGDKKHGERAD